MPPLVELLRELPEFPAFRISRHVWRTRLSQRPLLYGAAYGLLLYAVMTWVVVPLSNAPQGKPMPLAWTLSSIAMHALIGVLCAWIARIGLRGR